jgi:hypothetical protein
MLPEAHVGGVPVEETLGMLGPAFLVAVGAAAASLRRRGGRLLEGTLRRHRRDRLVHRRNADDAC